MKRRNTVAYALLMTVMAFVLITNPVMVLGQSSASEINAGVGASQAVAVADADAMTWREIVENGGWLMYVLGVVSFILLALILYFIVVLRRSQIVPLSLYRELMDKIELGAMDDARKACEYRPSALSMVVMTGIDCVKRLPDADPVVLNDMIEGEGSRQAESLQGQIQYLADIGAIAPMIGLLGTVFGMLRAFGGVAREIANAKPVVLAAGVSQALITTAFGLIVGILAMGAYAFFRRKASKLTAYLEAASTDVMTALLSKRRSVLSTRDSISDEE